MILPLHIRCNRPPHILQLINTYSLVRPTSLCRLCRYLEHILCQHFEYLLTSIISHNK